jgi:hypothetical protein
MNKDLDYLNDNKYFDVNGFLKYINNKHPECGSGFVAKIIMKILNEAATEFNYDDMEFITRVSFMLDIDVDDVKKFADDLMIKTPIKE